MWSYEKHLQFPVKITNPNPRLAKAIIAQYGGPHGELGAANRYLAQRFASPYQEITALLTDIGTEELGHTGYQSQARQNRPAAPSFGPPGRFFFPG